MIKTNLTGSLKVRFNKIKIKKGVSEIFETPFLMVFDMGYFLASLATGGGIPSSNSISKVIFAFGGITFPAPLSP